MTYSIRVHWNTDKYVRSTWFLALLYSLQLLGTEHKVIISNRGQTNIQRHISHAHSCFASELSLVIEVDYPIFPCWSKWSHYLQKNPGIQGSFCQPSLTTSQQILFLKKNSHVPSNDSSVEKNKNKNKLKIASRGITTSTYGEAKCNYGAKNFF